MYVIAWLNSSNKYFNSENDTENQSKISRIHWTVVTDRQSQAKLAFLM